MENCHHLCLVSNAGEAGGVAGDVVGALGAGQQVGVGQNYHWAIGIKMLKYIM